MSSKAGAKVEEPTETETLDVPAGGLDAPLPRQSLEEETFPGENLLTEEERNRWLILHFALPRTIMTCDLAEGKTTESELNDALSQMAWGTINEATAEWLLESEEPTLHPPHESFISYAEYVERIYPADPNMEKEAQEENSRMASQKRCMFTCPGEPGVKFRPMFDQMVKCLAHPSKIMKTYGLTKPILDENEVPEDPEKDDPPNIMRYGRHQVLPSFWNMLINLTKIRRRFSIVFHTFGSPELPEVQRELKYFCQAQHPAFKIKLPPMNGDKGSRDLRLKDEHIGNLDRVNGRLEFLQRSAVPSLPVPAEGEEKQVADGEAAAEGTEAVPPQEFQPTVYEFPPYHAAYAGLMHHILEEANTAAITYDYEYWKAKHEDSSAGKLLLVDHGDGVAETKVQHIFFDGHIAADSAGRIDVRDVVSGDPLPFKELDGMFLHRVNLFQAITDGDYYSKALEACELNMSQKIVQSRRVRGSDIAETSTAEKPTHQEYLYRNIIPALLPALQACERDRPADPIEFIAFYMLRHPKQYSKTLKTSEAPPAST